MNINKYFDNHIKTISNLNSEEINYFSKKIQDVLNNKNTIFTCGNGGSAHNASHCVTDWAKLAGVKNNKIYKCFCLNDNQGLISAFANDVNYDLIFSEMLKIYADKDDLVLLFTGSGNSKNIINCINYLKLKNIEYILFCGFDGGEAKKISTQHIHVKSNDMQVVEDIHLSIIHYITKYLCNFS